MRNSGLLGVGNWCATLVLLVVVFLKRINEMKNVLKVACIFSLFLSVISATPAIAQDDTLLLRLALIIGTPYVKQCKVETDCWQDWECVKEPTATCTTTGEDCLIDPNQVNTPCGPNPNKNTVYTCLEQPEYGRCTQDPKSTGLGFECKEDLECPPWIADNGSVMQECNKTTPQPPVGRCSANGVILNGRHAFCDPTVYPKQDEYHPCFGRYGACTQDSYCHPKEGVDAAPGSEASADE